MKKLIGRMQRKKPCFDIITGQSHLKKQKPERKLTEGIRMVGDGLGDEAPRRGNAILRESAGRYFAPYPCGVTAEYRQDVLLREGISKKKMTSILQLGKSDLPSYGFDDQLGKSQYSKRKELTGLFELTKPGAFSPTKQPRNPSGNAEIVRKWNKGFSVKPEL